MSDDDLEPACLSVVSVRPVDERAVVRGKDLCDHCFGDRERVDEIPCHWSIVRSVGYPMRLHRSDEDVDEVQTQDQGGYTYDQPCKKLERMDLEEFDEKLEEVRQEGGV